MNKTTMSDLSALYCAPPSDSGLSESGQGSDYAYFSGKSDPREADMNQNGE